MSIEIPKSHPRAQSLEIREKIIAGCQTKVVAFAGLIAHGRGEAFDYLLGEATPPPAHRALKAAAAKLLLATRPVISVNGNVAILCPRGMVQLAEISGARLEINLFYRTREREEAILKVMQEAGARDVLGLDSSHSRQIPELQSKRRIVDARGIFAADVVLVPLEDGDRTEALVKQGKYVVTIDLNPLSRTARKANLSIIDEVIRAMDLLVEYTTELKSQPRSVWQKIWADFDNNLNLAASLKFISTRLQNLAKKKLPDT